MCDPGYSVLGLEILTCGLRGWSSPPPTCEPILCPNVTEPKNGRLSGACSPGMGDKTCTLICNAGFRPTTVPNMADPKDPMANIPNTATILCMQNRQWNGTLGMCVPITCPALPPSILNGIAQGGSFCSPGLALKLCSYQCNPGFAITGSSSALLCQLNGNWSGGLPSCTRILCRSIVPMGGQTTMGQCDPGFAETSCIVECKPGYAPLGQQVINCTSNGTWSNDPTPCSRIECSPPLRQPDNGYFVTGVTTGILPGPTPVRIPINSTCSPGYGSGFCVIQCNRGYLTIDRLSSVTITCDARGKWSSPTPECLRVACPPIIPPENGVVSSECISALSGETCFIKCNVNYRGGGLLRCLENGNWNLPTLSCARKQCNNFNVTIPIANGVLKGAGCSFSDRSSVGLAGECCVYSCNAGFGLIGSSSIDCIDPGPQSPYGIFNLNGPFPMCVQLFCPSLVDTDSVMFDQSAATCSTIPGSKCPVKCADGEPSVMEITCTELAKWDTDIKDITCTVEEKKMCPPISKFDNGMTSGDCNPGIVGEKCSFTCNFAFALVGNPEITCTDIPGADMGKFDLPQPFCRPVLCPGLNAPTNGRVDGTCAPGLPGTRCNFACNDGFNLLPPGAPTVLECNADGMWSADPPTCGKATCPPLRPPPGGYLSGVCTPGRGGESCGFICPPGFNLNGLTNVICMSDGGWSGPVPRCVRSSGGGGGGGTPGGAITPGPGVPPDDGARPGCRPRRRCCPRLWYPKPFIVVRCRNMNHNYLPEVGTICHVGCRSSLTTGEGRSIRRAALTRDGSTRAKLIVSDGHEGQKTEEFNFGKFFGTGGMRMTCMRNQRWSGSGDPMGMSCGSSPQITQPSDRPDKGSDRPWVNIMTNKTIIN